MKPTDNIEKLLENMNVIPAPDKDQQMLNAVLQAQAKKQTPATLKPGTWRYIMKNPMTKYAAAAMLFIAVILGVNLIPGTEGPLALASIIETFKNATCISYDLRVGDDSPVIHDTVYGNRIRRQTMGSTVIIDLDNQKILTLVPDTKQAITIGFDGLPEMPKNYIDHLVNILSGIQKHEELKTEPLEPQIIDGQMLNGYFFRHENLEVEIWIDADTSLPAVIVEKRPGLEVTMSNFNFDVEHNPSMFSMDPPEGYTLIDGQNMIDFKKDATEENFIALLKMLAEINDGWFLQDISIEYIVKNAMEIGQLIEKTYEGTMEQMQAGMLLGKGATFLRFFKGQGQWHYAGNGVQLGQSEDPIFWHQPKDSELFRVIFGDLHVEEAAPEDLDAIVSVREGYTGFSYQLWDKTEIVGQQEDNWYIKRGNIIKVHSTIDIRKAPMHLPAINITLPYENATLISATLGETALPFEKENVVDFRFFPDGQLLANGEHIVNLIWEFPLNNLELADYGYVAPLQSFVPITSYKLHVTLEPNCNWIFKKNPDQLKMTPFTISMGEPKTTFGTCGLAIKSE